MDLCQQTLQGIKEAPTSLNFNADVRAIGNRLGVNNNNAATLHSARA